MPGSVPPVCDERHGLLAYLAQQRYGLRLSAYGLTDQQIRETPSASALSIGGLIQHVATAERGWMDIVLQRHSGSQEEYQANFHLGAHDTLDDVLALYDQVAAETEEIVAGLPDLGFAVPVPSGVPWFPDDVEAWSLRWVLLHLIEETARHAGHADIIRESIDGATFHPLMAAAEGWPASPWLQPWQPALVPA
jgi:uncharacterized damage-inducible protein DinB